MKRLLNTEHTTNSIFTKINLHWNEHILWIASQNQFKTRTFEEFVLEVLAKYACHMKLFSLVKHLFSTLIFTIQSSCVSWSTETTFDLITASYSKFCLSILSPTLSFSHNFSISSSASLIFPIYLRFSHSFWQYLNWSLNSITPIKEISIFREWNVRQEIDCFQCYWSYCSEPKNYNQFFAFSSQMISCFTYHTSQSIKMNRSKAYKSYHTTSSFAVQVKNDTKTTLLQFVFISFFFLFGSHLIFVGLFFMEYVNLAVDWQICIVSVNDLTRKSISKTATIPNSIFPKWQIVHSIAQAIKPDFFTRLCEKLNQFI